VTDKVFLASGSPRRRELISEITEDFVILKAAKSEPVWDSVESPSAYLNRVLEHKWKAARGLVMEQNEGHSKLLVADTIVVLGQKVLGKPENPGEAIDILRLLSGRKHEVWTGFILDRAHVENPEKHRVVTQVEFKKLRISDIKDYVRTGEPMDKAGAYGFQDKAFSFVRGVRGPCTNIVGLPVMEVRRAFEALQ
jgi:septum formation protein